MIDSLCRICVKNIKKGFSFHEKHKQYKLSLMFEDLTGIKIEPNSDTLPSKICCECLDKLYSAFEVRKLCIESDAFLRNQLQSETSKEVKSNEIENLENYDNEMNWKDDDTDDDLNFVGIDLDDSKSVCDGLESQENDDNKGIPNDNATGSTSRNPSPSHKDFNLEKKCPTCDKSFQCEATLNKHMFIHNKLSNCPLCPKTYSNTSNLKRHIATHSDKLKLNCDKCSKVFTETTALYEHLKIHRFDNAEKSDEYLLECEICKEKTVSFASYYKHMKINHNIEDKIKAFKCRICDMRFASKQGMYRHIDNIHENNRQNLRNRDKNFLCTECGKGFLSNFHLTTHSRSHSGAKPFHCKYCSKSFSQSSGLKIHTLIHMKIRPFACKVCNKTFTQYGHVREHLLTHTDDRPYTCTICNHSFRVKGNLKAHMLIHLGKKPWFCEHCEKRFNQRTHLRQHIIKKHKISN